MEFAKVNNWANSHKKFTKDEIHIYVGYLCITLE